MHHIANLSAFEILDSRGRPTVEARCTLAGGASARAQVPSGASTGRAEALELRDTDAARYGGRGCQQAVANIEGPIAAAVRDSGWTQQSLDAALIELDGTSNKSNLGGNAILSVSIAFARACALERTMPLYLYFGELIGVQPSRLPRLTVNLFSGGKHAGGQVPLQDVLVVPADATTVAAGLEHVVATYDAAAELIGDRYGVRRLTADEGGLAPPFPSVAAMFDDAVASIESAGLTPGTDMALAVDVAASHFFDGTSYHFGDKPSSSAELLQTLADLATRYPIVSLEDGLAEDDWTHWPALRSRLAPRSLTLGDDLLCTNPERITRAIETRACDALLLKVNQIGTLSEAATALRLAREAGWRVTISARSGETEDDWLADLAVGWSGDQIKVGAINQSERLAKYNRLLAIERETGWPVVAWPN